MVEKAKEKGRARAKRRREREISSFVVISIVLSVLFAASVAIVSAPPPPPSVDNIIVTADPTWIPADGFSRSTITATVLGTNMTGNDIIIRFDILPPQYGNTLTNTTYKIVNYSDTNRNATTELMAGMDPGTVTIRADAVDIEAPENTTTVELIPTPEIIGHNNKTGSSLSVTINESECVYFNATADQPIDTWRWFVDDVNQTHNFDDFTYCGWGVNGTYYVKVNGTNNANGTSNTVTWTVTVNDITPPAKVEGLTNGTPTYTTVDLWWDVNPAPDLVGYKVYQGGSLINTTANTYYNVTGLSPSTTYEFNVSAYDDNDLEGEPATVMVTTPGYPAPTIIDWYNNKTGSSLSVTISESECVYFNATADQTIGVWSWFVDGADQGNNLDEFTYCGWSVSGTYYVKTNATNANGTSGTITWTVNVGIEDTESPVVTNPNASPATILNDNGRPRPPGTNVSQLNVTVTDAGSGVSTVTIDLSSVGGSATQDMVNIGGDVWSVETSATVGINLTHNLAVNATDNAGYSNTSVSISLTVLRRGDIVRDNVVDDGDLMYIAKYIVGKEPEPDQLVADVWPADNWDGVDDGDLMYIAKYIVGKEFEP